MKLTHNEPSGNLCSITDTNQYHLNDENRCFIVNILSVFGKTRYINMPTHVIDVNIPTHVIDVNIPTTHVIDVNIPTTHVIDVNIPTTHVIDVNIPTHVIDVNIPTIPVKAPRAELQVWVAKTNTNKN